MPDLKEKLVELLAEKQYHGMGMWEHGMQAVGNADIADHLLANGVIIQKWIPVSEGLPKKFGDYCVTVRPGVGKQYSDFATFDPFEKRWTPNLSIGRRGKITHWMPLPKPRGDDI